jgi:hypothetical protein
MPSASPSPPTPHPWHTRTVRYGTPSYAPPEALAVHDGDVLASEGARWGLAPSDLGRPAPDYDAGRADVWALAVSALGVATKVLPWTTARHTDGRFRAWAAAWGEVEEGMASPEVRVCTSVGG